MEFTRIPHPAPTADDVRDAKIADPGFGTVFTDHMVTIDYDEAKGGWQTPVLGPREPIALDPAASVLHYAQEIFEGMKAYRHPDGSLGLFRPEANAQRFNKSADRLAMPNLPEEMFLASIRELLSVDGNWYPDVEDGSLYLRPFMIATEAFLGVRPAKQYKYVLIACPAGGYFKSGAKAVSIWLSDYTRAAPGGTGAAKCGGNYAASLVPTGEAFAKGHDQVLFLDAVERKWVEELGGMNLFFVMDDGRVITPKLTGTILPGITRDSLIQLLREEGLSVEEGMYSIDQWREDAESGKLVEVMACGTAAVVTAVGKVAGEDGTFTIGAGGIGQTTAKLREKLVGIQRGTVSDTHGWVMKLD
ncbi:branched-chain amino acid aminotransferase [Altererythrobacter sp.]|uniref:branched-chain amino acid aminotransferase n=1 Tax=Altererythrobacter sp. TaxID=1872480 RepID=UPI001B291626|nr:branched-chain amino acid aminotransferase [Altererythrobacter sp.]MBO6608715.1 branched-chain amino acid aminotransferase [Altererythrobacter sp.]MBO6642970.1 branched-chain amino acid aminotransferase [Altererythrobacter sp.]MBO6709713.1 branched-chain amino acid aminotransferase [Altererythrobacter sp.]